MEPVIEVLPEPALHHFLPWIAVGRAHETDIHFPVFGRADRLHHPGLNEAEQLGLEIQVHLTDLIKKQGAFVSLYRRALPVSTGEGSPFTWPKISLSIRSRGIAAQFRGTNRAWDRALCAWMASAQTSLPVPLSPVTNTVALERAAASIDGIQSCR